MDTSVLVAAIRSDRGASRQLLLDALDGRYTVLASVPLIIEYEAVLTRPEHLQAARLSERDVAGLLDALAVVVEPVHLAYLWRPMLPDADDDMVLETAVNGGAELLVTLNLQDFASAQQAFRIAIASPADALGHLRGRR